MKYVLGFQKILAARGLSFGYALRNESLERNILYLLTNVHITLVTYAQVDQRIWFNVDSLENEVVTYMQFQHYSNQLVYLLIPFCLASLITSSSSCSKDMNMNSFENLSISPNQGHIQQYTYLRQLFAEDFVCQQGVELMEIMFATETWNSLILRRDSNSNYNIEPRNLKYCLKRALAPFIISYWGVALTLLQIDPSSVEPLEIKPFGKICQNTLREKLGSRVSQYYGALSLDCINNAVVSLINSGGLMKAKMYETKILHNLFEITFSYLSI